MNIIRQKNTENELHNIVRQFTSLIGLSKLAKLVNYRRHSEISLMKVIEWLLTTKFLGRSLYRARETPNFTSRTVRNNLNDGRINWQRLVCQVGGHLIKHLRPFIDRRRRLALIIDDTLFSREYATQTELLARVFDHDKQLYIKGYRALTLGWSDANTFLPINFALMSSKKPQNVLGKSAKRCASSPLTSAPRWPRRSPRSQTAKRRRPCTRGLTARSILTESPSRQRARRN